MLLVHDRPMSKKLKSYRFDSDTIALIEQLKRSLHLENNSAVLRKAITLLNLANSVVEGGGKLVVRDDNGDREILL